MKLRNLFMAVLAGAATLVACEPEQETVIPKITLSPETLSFGTGEDTKTVALTASMDWSVVTDLKDSWVAIDKVSGKASSDSQLISVTVDANTDFTRSIDIVFSINLAKATLSITQEGPKGVYVAVEGDGTKDSPYNVSQAADLVKDLSWTDNSTYDKTEEVYVKGKIASIKYYYDFAQGTATFDISDDGTAAGVKLTAYTVYYLQGNKWLEGNSNIALGDVVVLYGKLQNYKGNTPETVKGAYLYSLNGVTEDNNGHAPDLSDVESKTIAEFIAAASTSTYYKITGTVYGSINTQYGNFYVKDDTGHLQVYGASNWNDWKDKVQVGSVVTVAGTYKQYNGTDELVNGFILSCEEGAPVDYDALPSTTVKAFIEEGETGTMYKLTGKVEKFNSNYCSFDLTDDTGTVYIYSVDDKAKWASVLQDGATVTLAGAYKKYTDKSGNVKHEIEGAHIISCEGGVEPINYDELPESTIAAFIAGGESGIAYKLKGTVSGSINTQYGNFDLVDETGTIYVYGCDNWAEWKDKVVSGCKLTVAGKYKKYEKDGKVTDEIVNAHILLLEEGDPAPEEDPEGTGTLEDPYNPKAAYDVALALESGAKTENDVYIKGKVCSVKYTFNAQYGTATFNISQDGTTVGVQFPCYSVLYLGNKAWEEGDSQVAVGDEVIICGKLTNYQGNTPETASKEAYVYSINGQTSIEKSDVFGVESKDVNVSATATSAVVKVTGNVAWTASSTATIDKTSGEGAAEITVNFAANEDTENSKTYTVTLTTAADVAEKEIVVTITQSKARSADEHYVKIETTKALSWSTVSDDTYKEGRSVTVDDVTVTAYRNTSNTGFDNFLQDNHIRIFKNYVLKIDAGATITKVILNCAFSDKCFNITAIDGTVGVADTSAKTVTWEGSLNPFIAEMTGGQNRVASIEVYFE